MRPPPRTFRAGRRLLRPSTLVPALLLCGLVVMGLMPLHGGPAAGGGGDAGSGGAAGRRRVSQLATVADAVTGGAGVHGFVHKEGPADPRNWHPDHKPFRLERLATWMGERQTALAAGQLPPPLPIYNGCQVYVNHLYKVLFLRHAKTASSSLFCHFGGCAAAAANASEAEAASTKALSFELFQAKSVEQLEALWRDYFVVSFVRNPYQRAVSSYRMMMRQLALGGEAAGAYNWTAFAADPTGFADVCMGDAQCKKRNRGFVYVHIQPQHPCLVTESGGWAVDFVGRVESIDEDLEAVLQELERRRPPEAPEVKPLEGSLANVNGRGCNETAAATGHSVAREQHCEPAEWYQGEHAAAFAQIAHHFQTDVEGLRFGGGDTGTAVQRRQRR
ncbi:hypothetical protein C2E20_3378 [Micractinium conductrix]|uniref:Sulfotransferase family n=1 Tax=Micractinium conductrix TaxID=554055 RepID=A0A2P6VH83_9CHLO|nr:hypothetical protein C2E20_3378 [Micractinium conductrix]|eukprot:PSC73449.1 hypothetical protein C2E20_3378 [Micractinium conductrix]